MASPLSAANAYASLARVTQGVQGPEKSGQDFGGMLKEALGSVMQAGRTSDAQAQAMVAGKANVVDVVTAVAETETAIDAVVAVRDKVIQAYEEIMRMPI
ncbi:MAG: flagellar hook-basal body complex protein FliE [Pseudorhodoplanes sp.]